MFVEGQDETSKGWVSDVAKDPGGMEIYVRYPSMPRGRPNPTIERVSPPVAPYRDLSFNYRKPRPSYESLGNR